MDALRQGRRRLFLDHLGSNVALLLECGHQLLQNCSATGVKVFRGIGNQVVHIVEKQMFLDKLRGKFHDPCLCADAITGKVMLSKFAGQGQR